MSPRRSAISTEAYLELNFQQSRSQYSGLPSSIYANAPAGIYYPPYSTRGSGPSFAPGSGALTLPVYVCAARVNCTAANGTLNPNNPFAAFGPDGAADRRHAQHHPL